MVNLWKLVFDPSNTKDKPSDDPDNQNLPNRNVEARREERSQASGSLTLQLLQASKLVEGQLLDVSTHGFRLRHDCLELTPGQQVQVLYSWGKVWAHVIWTKEQGPHYHSGFELGQEE